MGRTLGREEGDRPQHGQGLADARYRLDRSGDRKLNRALHMILVARKRSHPATIAYIERCVQEGKHDARQTAASSATSPAASTAYSNTERHWRLDRHRSIT